MPLQKGEAIHQILEADAELPDRKVFYRPHGVQEWLHFKCLDMVDYPNATTERLTRAYKRFFRSKPMDVLDQVGKPYWEMPQ